MSARRTTDEERSDQLTEPPPTYSFTRLNAAQLSTSSNYYAGQTGNECLKIPPEAPSDDAGFRIIYHKYT